MYYRFCKPPILKRHYGIKANLSPAFGIHASFLQGIRCSETPLLMVELFWWLLLSTFLLPPDSLIFPFHDSQLVGKGYLTVKVLNEMGFCILLLCPKPCDRCVILMQAPTKCFDLPANGTSAMLLDNINLFINWWTFLDFHWIGFPGFKSMLKKNCCEANLPTISLLLTPFLFAVGMTLLLLLVTVMEYLRSFLCEKKLCPSLFFGAFGRLNEKAFCVCKYLFGLFLRFDGVSNMFPEVFSE